MRIPVKARASVNQIGPCGASMMSNGTNYWTLTPRATTWQPTKGDGRTGARHRASGPCLESALWIGVAARVVASAAATVVTTVIASFVQSVARDRRGRAISYRDASRLGGPDVMVVSGTVSLTLPSRGAAILAP